MKRLQDPPSQKVGHRQRFLQMLGLDVGFLFGVALAVG